MGPLGYQGSKAAMNTISQADVVLALGTRLGPFGALPQHGFDYWPKSAKIIQVDINARKLGLTKDIDVGLLGDAKLTLKHLLLYLKQTHLHLQAQLKQDLHWHLKKRKPGKPNLTVFQLLLLDKKRWNQ